MPTSKAATTPHKPVKETVKETIISVIIAFALAFVFRAFVAEAYVIPTGSMAPTLNGAHTRMHSPTTGADWAVGPWILINGDSQNPAPQQGTAFKEAYRNASPVPEGQIVHDPITGERVVDPIGISRTGDRIFVHKYLYALSQPEPWDVIVFKDPTNPDQNFIKRLIGLPNEEIALVAGDVFVRKLPRPAGTGLNWQQDGWQIRRKPQRVQEAVWQCVYDSSFVPAVLPSGSKFVSPWAPGSGSPISAEQGGRMFTYNGVSPATLAWNADASFVADSPRGVFDTGSSQIDGKRALNDRYPYNEIPNEHSNRVRYAVGDLRVRFGLQLDAAANPANLVLAPTVTADGHAFRAMIESGNVRLQMRPESAEPQSPWTELLTAPVAMPALTPGTTVDVEFWHVDQSLALYVAGTRIAYAAYEWSPARRLTEAASAAALEAVARETVKNPLDERGTFKSSGARIEIAGAKATLHRVGLDRDLFYTPASYRKDPPRSMIEGPALATSPLSPLALGPDQFFACGDNSPNSSDGRLWTIVDPWVAHELDPTMGIVDRRLLLGKAFFVYWPALGGNGRIPVPDVGRMRFIQ